MKKNFLGAVFILSSLAAFLSVGELSVALAAPTSDKEFQVRTFSKPGPTKWVAGKGRDRYEENRLLLTANEEITDEEIDAAVKDAHGQLISITDMFTTKLIVIETNHGFFDKAENKLKANKKFRAVGRNHLLDERSSLTTPVAIAAKPVKTPTSNTTPVVNDPYFPNQWHLKAINAASVFAQFYTSQYPEWPVLPPAGSGNYTLPPATGSVGIIDSGCSTTAPDLSGQKVWGVFWCPYNSDGTRTATNSITYISGNTNFVPRAWEVPDSTGHGTQCASIACARANDKIGIAGVCPGCFVVPIVVHSGSPPAPTTLAMSYALGCATSWGPRVLNCSLGPPGGTLMNDPIIMDGINIFSTSNRSGTHPGGGLIFLAAGEGVTGTVEPGTFNDNAIYVGSIDQDYKISSFSNYGGAIQFYMPGRDILTCGPSGVITKEFGTSFSTPMAAAAAAMVWWANPSLTRSQVLSILRSTASNGGKFSVSRAGTDGRTSAYGVIDVGKAVSAARYGY